MKTATLWIGAAALVLTVACNRNEAAKGSVLGGDRNQAKMTLTGCLQSGEQGLASREPNSTSRSPEGADQFVLTNAKMPGSPADSSPSASSPASTGSLFILEGEKAELQQHVGQQVEVVGEPKNDRASTPDANRANVRRLDVESVRMIAEHCSGI
jgi:hypothetical protein